MCQHSQLRTQSVHPQMRTQSVHPQLEDQPLESIVVVHPNLHHLARQVLDLEVVACKNWVDVLD